MQDYLELLKQLMLCRSVTSDIAAVNKASALLRDFLTNNGLACTTEDCDGRNVLFASTVPGKQPDFLLNAHIDVVPTTSPEQHSPVIDGDIVRGRGANDCLGNAVCIAKCLVNLNRKASVAAFFTCDEETGGKTTAAMLARGYRANKMAIVIDASPFCVTTAQKGILILKLTAHGKAGHASEPWAFDNAIEKLINGFARLKCSWPAVTVDDQWHNTMTPCIISGGNADNQIPDTASLIINIRFINDSELDSIVSTIKNVTDLEVTKLRVCHPLYTDENNPLLISLLDAIQKEFPDKKASFCRMNGATDARHMSCMKVPVAIIGTPGGGAHSDAEWADFKGITKYAKLLSDFITTQN